MREASMIKSLRLQLASWYLAFFSVMFLAFCLVLYGSLSNALERRLAEGLTTTVNISAKLLQEELDEMDDDAPQAAAEVISKMGPSSGEIAIFEGSNLLAATDPGDKEELESAAAEAIGGSSERVAWILPHWGKSGARAGAKHLSSRGHTFVVLAVEPMDSMVRGLQVLRQTFWLVMPLLLALAGVGGYLLTRRGLAPLGSMAEQTRTITGQNLERRLEIGKAAEELTTLAASFNELLSRLDQSFGSMRRFVQDASHELRTPLAVIRSEADVALSHDRTTAEYKESLAVIQEESRRLSRLVDDLLNLARADAGHAQLHVEQLYLNDLLSECCRSVQPLAAARNIELECRSGEDVAVQGDEELLRRMMVNLLDNAIRYTPPGGRVSATIEAHGADVRIRVVDTGVGIAPDATGHVFERFYRADKVRNRQQGGFGLGLAIVKWIAESHHGAVDLTSQPGQGSTFTVRLPAVN
jgi:two-component system OmpR family sensor kinase